jgi:hypothetical protein
MSSPICLILLLSFSSLSVSTTSSSDSSHLSHSAEQTIHQDSRCFCKCPAVTTVTKDKYSQVGDPSRRSVYINASVTPDDCDCGHVVLPYITDPPLTEAQADAFCPRRVLLITNHRRACQYNSN